MGVLFGGGGADGVDVAGAVSRPRGAGGVGVVAVTVEEDAEGEGAGAQRPFGRGGGPAENGVSGRLVNIVAFHFGEEADAVGVAGAQGKAARRVFVVAPVVPEEAKGEIVAGALGHVQGGGVGVFAVVVDEGADGGVGGRTLDVPDAVVAVVAFEVEQGAEAHPVADPLAEDAGDVLIPTTDVHENADTTGEAAAMDVVHAVTGPGPLAHGDVMFGILWRGEIDDPGFGQVLVVPLLVEEHADPAGHADAHGLGEPPVGVVSGTVHEEADAEFAVAEGVGVGVVGVVAVGVDVDGDPEGGGAEGGAGGAIQVVAFAVIKHSDAEEGRTGAGKTPLRGAGFEFGHRAVGLAGFGHIAVVAAGVDDDTEPMRSPLLRGAIDVSVVAASVDDEQSLGIDIGVVARPVEDDVTPGGLDSPSETSGFGHAGQGAPGELDGGGHVLTTSEEVRAIEFAVAGHEGAIDDGVGGEGRVAQFATKHAVEIIDRVEGGPAVGLDLQSGFENEGGGGLDLVGNGGERGDVAGNEPLVLHAFEDDIEVAGLAHCADGASRRVAQ